MEKERTWGPRLHGFNTLLRVHPSPRRKNIFLYIYKKSWLIVNKHLSPFGVHSILYYEQLLTFSLIRFPWRRLWSIRDYKTEKSPPLGGAKLLKDIDDDGHPLVVMHAMSIHMSLYSSA